MRQLELTSTTMPFTAAPTLELVYQMMPDTVSTPFTYTYDKGKRGIWQRADKLSSSARIKSHRLL